MRGCEAFTQFDFRQAVHLPIHNGPGENQTRIQRVRTKTCIAVPEFERTGWLERIIWFMLIHSNEEDTL